jgi:hypothetical protein
MKKAEDGVLKDFVVKGANTYRFLSRLNDSSQRAPERAGFYLFQVVHGTERLAVESD